MLNRLQIPGTVQSLSFSLCTWLLPCFSTFLHMQPALQRSSHCSKQCSNSSFVWSDCRHRQQAHLTSSPANPTWSDIFHAVLTLPELLNMDDQKALSAVSRSLRRSFVAKIQVVTVTNDKDLALVNQSWPLLSMVILHTEVDRYFASLQSARSLALVDISAKVTVPVSTPDMSQSSLLPYMPRIYEKIFLLKPLHTSASLALASSAAKQLADHLLGSGRS